MKKRPLAKLTAALAIGALIAGCAAPSGSKSPPAPSPAPAPAPLDPSYDWHALLVVPFGGSLKDVPFSMHEVLLFHDQDNTAAADTAECYAIETTAPRFVARTAQDYLLCFKNDRLVRVEAAVQLPEPDAAKIFADACGMWLKNADPGATAPTAAAGECTGREGTVGFSGRLDAQAGADTTLSVKLDGTAYGVPAAVPDRPDHR